MILRKLKPEQHYLTRPLWTRVFEEDTEEFLDYYYTEKTKDNEIYVIESEGAVRAMLHLNPYRLHVGRKEAESRYIVAVATDAVYRGQGYMSELLQKSMRDMYVQKMPFTFLMPAAEKIYYPHHFRYIYAARQWEAACSAGEASLEQLLESAGKAGGSDGGEAVLRLAGEADLRRLAQFAEKVLRRKYQIYAKRTWKYYERILLEQESQHGGILLAEAGGEIRASILFEQEQGFAVRDYLAAPGHEGIFERLGLKIGEKEQKKPIIMGRVLHVESLLTCMSCREEVQFQFWLVDPVIRENNKLFMIKGNREHIVVRTKNAKPKGDVQMISIDALTTLLFGYKTVEAVEKEEKETFSEDFKEKISKIIPMRQIFLNEIV